MDEQYQVEEKQEWNQIWKCLKATKPQDGRPALPSPAYISENCECYSLTAGCVRC